MKPNPSEEAYFKQRQEAIDRYKVDGFLRKIPFVERERIALFGKELDGMWQRELAIAATLEDPWAFTVAWYSDGSRTVIELFRLFFQRTSLNRPIIVDQVLDAIIILHYYHGLTLLDERRVVNEGSVLKIKITDKQKRQCQEKFPFVPEVIEFFDDRNEIANKIKSLSPKDLDKFIEDEVYLVNIPIIAKNEKRP